MLDRKQAPHIFLPKTGEAIEPLRFCKGIYLFQKKELEVFKLDIIFPDGGFGNEKVKKTNSICADMLLSGTSTKKAQQINESLDFLGSYFNIQTDYYKSVVTVYGLNKYFSDILCLIQEVISDSIFPEKELNLLKQQRTQNLLIQQKKTAFQCRKLMNEKWYGKNTILGKGTEVDDYEKISRQDIINAYSSCFKQAFFVLSTGQKSEIFAEEMSCTPFITLTEKDFECVSIKKESETVQAAYNMKESNQASLLARIEIPNRNHSDYPALSLLNVIFGGYFGSKLMKNIREDKGWTYGIHSHIQNHKDNAYLEISADIKSNKIQDVIHEINAEKNKLQNESITQQEWNAAKNYYIGNIQRSLDNFMNHSERFLSLRETSTTISNYNAFIKSVEALYLNDVINASHTYLLNKSFSFVWAGPE
jgi:zinc protease